MNKNNSGTIPGDWREENILIIPSFWTVSDIKHQVRLKWPVWWTPIGFCLSTKKQRPFRIQVIRKYFIFITIFFVREGAGDKKYLILSKCVLVKGKKEIWFVFLPRLGRVIYAIKDNCNWSVTPGTVSEREQAREHSPQLTTVQVTIFWLYCAAEAIHFSGNRTWNFECGSYPGLATRGTTLSRDAGQQRGATPSQPRGHKGNRLLHWRPRCLSLSVQSLINCTRYPTLYYKMGCVLEDFC